MSWTSPRPKRETSLQRLGGSAARVVLLAALCFFPFIKVLRASVLIYGPDTFSHDYLVDFFGWREVLTTGAIPLWNPYWFGGEPFVGSFAFCPFFPTAWLHPLLGLGLTPLAFNLRYPLALLIVALGAYFWGRAEGWSRATSLFAGVAFAMGGHVATLAAPGHLAKVEALAMMPWVLGFTRRWFERGGVGSILGAGVAFGLQLLASHFQIFYYTLLWIFGLALARAMFPHEPLKIGPRVRPLALVIVAPILGLCVAGPQMLPGLELARESNRQGPLAFEDATRSSYPPLEMLEMIFPRFTGDSLPPARSGVETPWWSGQGLYVGWWGERLVSDYPGMAVWLLAALGVFWGRRRKWYYVAVFAASGLLAMGSYTPLYMLAYKFLPGISHFRSPATIMCLMAVALVALSGEGLEAARVRVADASAERLKQWRNRILLSGYFVLVVLLFAEVWQFRAQSSVEKLLMQSAPPSSLIQERRTVFLYRSVARSSCVTALLLFVGSMSLYPKNRGAILDDQPRTLPRSARLAGWLLFALAYADTAHNVSRFIIPADAAPYHAYLAGSWIDAAAKRLSPPPHRLLEAGNELTNRPMMNEVASLHGYQPVAYGKYFDLWSGKGIGSEAFARLYAQEFVVSREPEPWQSRGWRPMKTPDGKFLLQKVDPPPAYIAFPEVVRVVGSEKEMLSAVLADDFVPGKEAVVTEAELGWFAPLAAQDKKLAAQGRVIDYQCDRVSLALHLPERRPVVVAEHAVAGWTARLDNDARNVPIHTANYFFRLVEVPAGEHRLVFEYRPFSYRLGLFLGLASLGLLVAAALGLCGRGSRDGDDPPESEGKVANS